MYHSNHEKNTHSYHKKITQTLSISHVFVRVSNVSLKSREEDSFISQENHSNTRTRITGTSS